MRIVAALLISLVVVLCPPMSAVSHAQSTADTAALQQLQTKITKEIDSRVATLEQTLDSLKSTAQSHGDQAAKTSVAIGESGLRATVVFPDDLKTKSKDTLQKITAELTKMKTKASSMSSLSTAQALANSLDSQRNLATAANVQAAVTQSVESMTGVFANLKATANNLQGQITLLKECAPNVASDEKVSSNTCQGIDTALSSTATAAQAELDSIGTMMMTIASTLASAIAVLEALLATFNNMLKAVGGTDGLSNLSNLINTSDITKLNTAFGDINGLLMSFTGIASQIDIASTMSTNVQDLLSALAKEINR